MGKLEKLAYDVKYSLGTYADVLTSIPIGAAELIAKGTEKIFGNKTPEFLTQRDIKENSQIFRVRENLREKLDTKPGATYIQSNIIGAIPFLLAGIPAAEVAQKGIESWISEAPEMVKYVTNSTLTLGFQMLTGYAAYFANEMRRNKHKFTNEGGKFDYQKTKKEIITTLKAFLAIDVGYSALKIGGQTWNLYKGDDPWKASAFFDSWAIPFWYGVCIPLGLHNRMIITNKSDELFPEKKTN